MATHTLSILKPSVNNLSVRVFVRAAGLDHEEVDMWGNKGTAEFLQKNPSDLTPLLEEQGLPKGSLWESCAIMQYLCNRDGLEQFYPSDPGRRAMVDSAMFYLVGTIYPLVARSTYPTLGFPQYAGEVATSEADDAMKDKGIPEWTSAPPGCRAPTAPPSRSIPIPPSSIPSFRSQVRSTTSTRWTGLTRCGYGGPARRTP
jgi:glutathione S-transferase